MPEVVIELNLTRRSGVLAGAVAALRPLALEFRSQQLGDRDGQPCLTLNTEGELTDLDELLETFGRARGVSDVADVRVDGQSLLQKTVASPEPEESVVEDRVPNPEIASAEAEPLVDKATEPAANQQPDANEDNPDGFNDREFARHVLAGDSESSESEQTTEASGNGETTGQRSGPAKRHDSLGPPTAAMLRRRRRRR